MKYYQVRDYQVVNESDTLEACAMSAIHDARQSLCKIRIVYGELTNEIDDNDFGVVGLRADACSSAWYEEEEAHDHEDYNIKVWEQLDEDMMSC